MSHSALWHVMGDEGIGLPVGAIIITSNGVPAGWEEWAGNEDRLIRGTGGDDSSHGGSNGSWSVGTDGGGSNHTGNSNSYQHHWRSGAGTWTRAQSASSKDSHSHSLTIGYNVPKNRRRFIKNLVDGAPVPAGADVLSDTNVLSEYDGDSDANVGDGFALTIKANEIGTASGGATSSMGSAGSGHNHYGTTDGSGGSAANTLRPESAGIGNIRPSGGGSHKHSASPNFSYSQKRTILRAWTRLEESNVIGDRTIVMYYGTGVPDGWFICDGSNNTINLVGYFIHLSTSNVGTQSGSDSISASVSIGNANSHSHGLNMGTHSSAQGYKYGHQQSVSHNHGASLSSRTWQPPFRTIKFIQRIES